MLKRSQLRGLVVLVGLIVFAVIGYLVLNNSKAATNADIDNNGSVGIGDLTILAANYGLSGKTFSQGNIDGDVDGNVNIYDFSILAAQWGQGGGSSTVCNGTKPPNETIINGAITKPVICGTVDSGTNVNMTWNTDPDVAYYEVYETPNATCFQVSCGSVSKGGGFGSATISGLSNGTHYFWINAANDATSKYAKSDIFTINVSGSGDPVASNANNVNNVGPPPSGPPSIASANGYTNLAFQDTFDTTTLDSSKWFRQYPWKCGENDLSWNNGNNSKYYPENVSVSGGSLRLKAERIAGTTDGQFQSNWKSGIVTSPNFKYKFGYAESRFKLPNGRGFFPAWWVAQAYYNHNCPNGADASGVHYKYLGEIDIMESVQPDISWVDSFSHTTHAFESDGTEHGQSFHLGLPDHDNYHTFGMLWNPDVVIYYLDGQEMARTTNVNEVPQMPAYLLLNLGVGTGFASYWNFAKWPDSTTPSPSYMYVDWVRIWTNGSTVTPSLSLSTSATTVTRGTNVNLTATKNDTNNQISKVDFYYYDPNDGHQILIGSDSSSPYTAVWSTSGLAAGEYELAAKAVDSSARVNAYDLKLVNLN